MTYESDDSTQEFHGKNATKSSAPLLEVKYASNNEAIHNIRHIQTKTGQH